jgi:hypothetical protein
MSVCIECDDPVVKLLAEWLVTWALKEAKEGR